MADAPSPTNATPTAPTPGAATSPVSAPAPSQSAPPTTPTSEPAPSQGAAPGVTAPSPSAEGETHESLLAAVTKAVPELRPEQQRQDDVSGVSPAPAAKPDAAASPPPDNYEDLSDDPTADEKSKYSGLSNRRIDKLIKQRNEARNEVVKAAAELKRLQALEPSAQAADHVTKFLRENDIGKDDFLLTLDLAA